MLELPEESTLSRWFDTPRGAYVLGWERAQFDSAVEDVFGFNAVQIGLPGVDFLRANRIPLRVRVGAEAGCAPICDPAQLPIASASVDLVVLPHVLEFAAEPHRILREVERVLMPDGQVVISGFNPLSLWGMKRMLSRRSSEHPWCGEFIGLLRLRDWLKLLGFELNGGRFGCYAPPVSQTRWLERLAFLEKAGDRWWPICGGVYVVRAVKRVHGIRLVTPGWRSGGVKVRALATVSRRDPVAGTGRAAARRMTPQLHLIMGGLPPRRESDHDESARE